ncbi:MAG: response regulator [Chloroflexota bacterium]
MADRIHILYIDDDPANQDSVSRALRRQGHIVYTARTGQEGISMAENDRPDLILLDILLPDMTGFDVCEHLRSQARFKRIPIIGISASAIDSDRRQSLSAGFDDYLAKPIPLFDLVNTIEQFGL